MMKINRTMCKKAHKTLDLTASELGSGAQIVETLAK